MEIFLEIIREIAKAVVRGNGVRHPKKTNSIQDGQVNLEVDPKLNSTPMFTSQGEQ
jgi:hypothetical protein